MPVRYQLHLPENEVHGDAEARAKIRELAHACRDIVADGVISPDELDTLHRWVINAGQILRYWPANAIAARVRMTVESGSNEDRAGLLTLLQEFAERVPEDSWTEQSDIFEQSVPRMRFLGRTFVLTGIFYFGTRGQCEEAILARGGQIRRAVSRSTDYVIVGGLPNPRWRNAGSGSKLEDALRHQQERRGEIKRSRSKAKPLPAPAVIRERDWVAKITGGPLSGFRFCVPGVFEDAVFNNDLHTGDVFYDVIEGYAEWRIALQKINYCVSIINASSGESGNVRFAISQPDEIRSKLIRVGEYTATQAEVIVFLKTGVMPQDFTISPLTELRPLANDAQAIESVGKRHFVGNTPTGLRISPVEMSEDSPP